MFESECAKNILVDYKMSGSFKVARALGFYYVDEPTGERYQSGRFIGEEKTKKVLRRSREKIDMWEWELQLNDYRMKFENVGFPIHEMRIQVVARDGGCWIAKARGVDRNTYYFKVKRLDDDYVRDYFKKKKSHLLKALKQGFWNDVCDKKENWNSRKCKGYCEISEYCELGIKFKEQEMRKQFLNIDDIFEEIIDG